MSRTTDNIVWIGLAAILAWLSAAVLFNISPRTIVGVILIIAGLVALATGLDERPPEALYRAGLAATLSFIGLGIAGLEPRYAVAGWLATLAGLAALRAVVGAARTPRRP